MLVMLLSGVPAYVLSRRIAPAPFTASRLALPTPAGGVSGPTTIAPTPSAAVPGPPPVSRGSKAQPFMFVGDTVTVVARATPMSEHAATAAEAIQKLERLIPVPHKIRFELEQRDSMLVTK